MRSLALLACLLAPSRAHAEHEHGPVTTTSNTTSTFTASLAMVAASYETMLYVGEYQGVAPSLAWSRGRFAAAASLPMYRLVGNGRTSWGLGDAIVHGQATLVGDHALAFGVVLALGIPTGEMRTGLGMGHAMAMPAVFASAHRGALRLVGSVGYGQALGSSHAHGGAWPLVDPMNQSEVTYAASSELALSEVWRLGARLVGAITTGEGASRTIAAARAGFARGRFDTVVEVQAGLVGDPFDVRGLVQTAVRF